jgi:hypothetical protein
VIASRDVDGSVGFDVGFITSDADGDAVSVDVFLSINADSNDGVRIARGLSGTAGSARVKASSVPAGVWHVFAVATDPRGGIAYASAPGTVEILDDNDDNATFRLLEPDGVDDIDTSGIVLITWSAEVPAGESGSIALFLDDGSSEQPIAGGLAVVSVLDGVEPARSYALDTNTLAPGQYTVRGVLTHSGGELSSDAEGVIVVTAAGCSSVRGVSGSGVGLPGALLLAMLSLLVAARRRVREISTASAAGAAEVLMASSAGAEVAEGG